MGTLDAGRSGISLDELGVRAFFAPARSQRALERSIRRFIQRFIVVNLPVLTSLDDHGPSFGGPLIINPISSLRTFHAMSPRNQQCVEVFEQTHPVTRNLRDKRVT